MGLWVAGAAAAFGLLAWRQSRFIASLGGLVREGDYWRTGLKGVGPAVIGAFAPRIILPRDFEDCFGDDEQALILAHERTHLTSGDTLVNAFLLLCQCIAWFNPLVHLAAAAVRQDQELACDAAVLAERPSQRQIYAQALLKAQLAANTLPLGCYWPSNRNHPLKERIAMLKLRSPSRVRILCGAAAISALCLGAGYAAWAAQPARVSTITSPAPSENTTPSDVLDPATGNVYPSANSGARNIEATSAPANTNTKAAAGTSLRAARDDTSTTSATGKTESMTRADDGAADGAPPRRTETTTGTDSGGSAKTASTFSIRADRITVDDAGNVTATGKTITIHSAASAAPETTRSDDSRPAAETIRGADQITVNKTDQGDVSIMVRRSPTSGWMVAIPSTGAATSIPRITQ